MPSSQMSTKDQPYKQALIRTAASGLLGYLFSAQLFPSCNASLSCLCGFVREKNDTEKLGFASTLGIVPALHH